MPNLDFSIESADVPPFAAAPMLQFKLCIANRDAEPIRFVMLKTQIQIMATWRQYNGPEQMRLREVFGEPHRWGDTLKSMPWTQTVILVPAFTGSTVVDLAVPCTYDFDVVHAKYFHALEDGVIPLEFLFSGTVFSAGSTGLMVTQIPWEKEATFRLPVRVWKEMMEQHFPNSAWVRLHREVFDRLYDYKVRNGLPTWEAALNQLLGSGEEGMG